MKIHFRFYVVKTEKFAISSFPNGVVLVSAELLPRLQNEAQLAAVLAADIALVMQEKIYELRTRRNVQNAIGWGALGTVVGAAAASVPVVGAPADILLSVNSVAWSDLIMSLERQAGRLALEYMLDAGYDPREAEGAFISLTRKSTIGPKLRLAERQYYQVMEGEVSQQLKQAYGDVKFSELKRDTEEYKKLLAH
jgi:predicted Zn-dependent protease